MIFKDAHQRGDLNGFLDVGSRLQGDLEFADTFRIDGRFSGSVTSDGDLIVGEDGEVDAEVKARRVFISGTVRGSLHASDKVEMTASAKVYADICAPSLSIEDGAVFEGHCAMKREAREPKVVSLAGERANER